MNKDRELQALKDFSNKCHSDWDELSKQLMELTMFLEKELEAIKRQHVEAMLDFEERLSAMEKTLKDYHIT